MTHFEDDEYVYYRLDEPSPSQSSERRIHILLAVGLIASAALLLFRLL